MLAEAEHRQVSVRAETLPLAGPASALAHVSEDAAMRAMIERAVRDPSVDVDKMERLMVMAERSAERRAKTAFASALAVMQPTLPVIDRRGCIEVPKKDNKEGHSTPYAKWEDINDAIRPLLAEHGFALSFRIGQAQDGKITVTGILSHREGHQEETTITLMHDATGSKNSVQAVGSSVSYGKRYTAMALLNITSRAPQDRDDDGQKADPSFWINEEHLGELTAFMDSVGADRDRFLRYFKIDTLAHLPASRFDEAMRLLQNKARR
jgi:hypothetical protein